MARPCRWPQCPPDVRVDAVVHGIAGRRRARQQHARRDDDAVPVNVEPADGQRHAVDLSDPGPTREIVTIDHFQLNLVIFLPGRSARRSVFLPQGVPAGGALASSTVSGPARAISSGQRAALRGRPRRASSAAIVHGLHAPSSSPYIWFFTSIKTSGNAPRGASARFPPVKVHDLARGVALAGKGHGAGAAHGDKVTGRTRG